MTTTQMITETTREIHAIERELSAADNQAGRDYANRDWTRQSRRRQNLVERALKAGTPVEEIRSAIEDGRGGAPAPSSRPR